MPRPSPFTLAADLFDPSGGKLGKYRDDPVAFVHDCIRWPPGQHPTAYQDEILAEIPRRKRVAVRGAHGIAKTSTASLFVLWFALTRDGADWKVPTTASAWRQLTQFLWPEIHKWARRLDWDRLGRPPFSDRHELLKLQLQLRTGQAFSVASDDPASIEGTHADHVAFVYDEAKSVSNATFDASEGAFSGSGITTAEGLPAEALAFAISTPGEPHGRFYEIHARQPGTEDWWVRHVTTDEAIRAGRLSPVWFEDRKRQWGEHSAVFQNRVLGEFASSDEDGVIPLAWVEKANERWQEWADAGKPLSAPLTALGVDVARGGADDTVFALRYGWTIAELRRHPFDADTTVTASRCAGILRVQGPGRAVVDAIGVGAGVFDVLRAEIGRSDAADPLRRCTVLPFVASQGSDRKDVSGELGFVNKRAEAWWTLREMLDPTGPASQPIALPPDDMLTGDLCAPRWRVMAGGRIQIESKEDIAKRLGRSTDAADAVVQAFYEEPDLGGGTAADLLRGRMVRR